jgi:L-ascorbate metabolism protein UlaG (beta-lactamase superfamily)
MLFLSGALLAILGLFTFLQSARFGQMPSGARKQRILKSSNYRNGSFMNEEDTPDLTEGATFFKVMRYFFFTKNKKVKPPYPLPSVKTDLKNLPAETDCLVWFGHSSYFLQLSKRNILVDPVFSGGASPVWFTTRSFPGSDVYTPSDIPEIDYLFLTHDHWDHLDYKTLLALKPKVKKIITSLGVGAHLERWGFHLSQILEADWNDTIGLEDGFVVHACSARHFSGRSFKRAQSVWSSFAFSTPDRKVFIGGDSGYGKHFKKIGESFGPFDFAFLECGQYNAFWKYIHMMPEETVQAAKDLGTRYLVPVHWAKFELSKHDWDEPIKRVCAEALKKDQALITPRIGELILLKNPASSDWWSTQNRT